MWRSVPCDNATLFVICQLICNNETIFPTTTDSTKTSQSTSTSIISSEKLTTLSTPMVSSTTTSFAPNSTLASSIMYSEKLNTLTTSTLTSIASFVTSSIQVNGNGLSTTKQLATAMTSYTVACPPNWLAGPSNKFPGCFIGIRANAGIAQALFDDAVSACKSKDKRAHLIYLPNLDNRTDLIELGKFLYKSFGSALRPYWLGAYRNKSSIEPSSYYWYMPTSSGRQTAPFSANLWAKVTKGYVFKNASITNSNWFPGEPDYNDSSKKCVTMNYIDGRMWRSTQCENTTLFVVCQLICLNRTTLAPNVTFRSSTISSKKSSISSTSSLATTFAPNWTFASSTKSIEKSNALSMSTTATTFSLNSTFASSTKSIEKSSALNMSTTATTFAPNSTFESSTISIEKSTALSMSITATTFAPNSTFGSSTISIENDICSEFDIRKFYNFY
uniref:C-type lectin domain-containing protein n=1 Tax=Romanomermis culicivorax TaxID=13658 RepID=A0A915IJG7_ROMCU